MVFALGISARSRWIGLARGYRLLIDEVQHHVFEFVCRAFGRGRRDGRFGHDRRRRGGRTWDILHACERRISAPRD